MRLRMIQPRQLQQVFHLYYLLYQAYKCISLGWQAVQTVWKIEPQLLVYLGSSMHTRQHMHIRRHWDAHICHHNILSLSRFISILSSHSRAESVAARVGKFSSWKSGFYLTKQDGEMSKLSFLSRQIYFSSDLKHFSRKCFWIRTVFMQAVRNSWCLLDLSIDLSMGHVTAITFGLAID